MKKQGNWVEFDRRGEDTPLLNRLLDPADREPIPVTCTDGSVVPFEQLAAIPYAGTLYLVLRPMQYIEGENDTDGISEDECIVFKYAQDDTDEGIIIETDDELVEAVYEAYIKLIETADEED